MEIKNVKLSELKSNPNNPRIIKDDKFIKLVNSIKEFPKMLEIRPIVVNADMIVLGGNMRLKACKEAGLKEVPVIFAHDLTEDEQKQFIIKDNVGFGEWDWDMLANEWEPKLLEDWGLSTPSVYDGSDINLDDFFEEDNSEKEKKNKIILEYTDDEYELVTQAFSNHTGSKEQIVFKLLGL
jgi:hypothetical protein